MRLLESLEAQNKLLVYAAAFGTIALIGLVDYFTGPAIGAAIFYVLPIAALTWAGSRSMGLLASVVSALIWLIAESATTSDPATHLALAWNSLIRLAFFLIITLLISALKRSWDRANTDHLTSAVNARFFYELVQNEINRAQRHPRAFTLAYMDLDNFKMVNDRFGHSAGDKILCALVASMRQVIRKSDVIARLGGDEFAVFFPDTDQTAALVLVSKIQSVFLQVLPPTEFALTLSVGVLTCQSPPQTVDELIELADRLMYAAKADGKNSVKFCNYPCASMQVDA